MKHFLIIVFYTTLITVLYWYLLGCPATGVDDANIYFTYAKNLVDGHGLVYNVGGERVEGFTSVVWMLVCAGAYWINPEYLVLILSMLNILIISLLVFLALRLLNRLNGKKQFFNLQSILFLGIFSLTPGVFEWNVLSLMETGLWNLGIFSLLYLIMVSINRQWPYRYLIIFIPVFVLIRPENIAWALMSGVIVFGHSYYKSKQLLPALKLLAGIVFVAFLSLALLTVWRLYYFGYPYPNTYYAKVSADLWYNLKEGFAYAIKFLINTPLADLGVILIPLAIWWGVKKLKNQEDVELQISQLVLLSFIICGFGIPILSGGDHFLLNRFYQPVIPILLLFLLHTKFWRQFISFTMKGEYKKYKWKGYFAAALMLIYFFSMCPLPWYIAGILDSSIKKEFEYVKRSKVLSADLATFFSGLDTLPYSAKQAVGGFGYYYEGKVLDVYGLNDTDIAHADKLKYGNKNHAAFHVPTFLLKHPDLFRFNVIDEDKRLSVRPQAVSDRGNYLKGLFENEAFKLKYEEVMIRRVNYHKIVLTFASKSFLKKLEKKGNYIIETVL